MPSSSTEVSNLEHERRARRKQERHAARRRDRHIVRLTKHGAKLIADAEEFSRNQNAMLARFANAGVPRREWKALARCRSGRCANSPCSAACWFGDRGKANQLMLEAAALLHAAAKNLYYVTIIDPHYAVPAGDLSKIQVSSILQSLRRRFQRAGALFGNDLAFGYVEVAMEVLPDGRRMWFAHLHFVLATDAKRADVREALRPARSMPDPEEWGRKRWKPVVVKPVTDLANLLAYNAKREVEVNINGADREEKRMRGKARLRPEHCLEHDLWLLAQKPADRIFKRRMKEVHGRLVTMMLKA